MRNTTGPRHHLFGLGATMAHVHPAPPKPERDIWEMKIEFTVRCRLGRLLGDERYDFLANHLVRLCNMDPEMEVEGGHSRSGFRRILTPTGEEYAVRKEDTCVYRR